MSENEYGNYVLHGKPGGLSEGPDGVLTASLDGPADWNGIKPRVGWKYISKPCVVADESHSHDFDEFLVFMAGDASKPEDLDAEIEISMGEEGEKLTFDIPGVVCVPQGLIHGPLKLNRVNKPVLFATFWLSPDYSRIPANVTGSTTGDKYAKYFVKGQQPDPRPYDTELWGCRIDEKTTAAAGKLSGNFNFYVITGSHVLPDPPHEHTFDEFLFLIPPGADNWPSLGGEVNLGLGKKWECQEITTGAVISIPAGLQHCPVFMKTVDKPFYWGHFLPISSYASSEYNEEAP